MPEQAGHAQQQRFLAFLGDEDQGEPQVVPEGDKVVDGHRRQRRPHEGDHDGREDAEVARAVDKARLDQLMRRLAHKLRQHKDRHRDAHRQVNGHQRPLAVHQAQGLDDLQQLDGADADGQHHARNQKEEHEARYLSPPVGQRVGGQRADDQHQDQRGDDD
ncbi:hypothetical protein SDC9_170537 [bioreactor metagenome]|uniref:Uncharacterized protein n=1 Tax=bioreactor metagenome TaxID=1076179 RepID=A0A645GAT7_9ZZZZ